MMKLLYVEDSLIDRLRMPELLTGGDAPWLRDVHIDAVSLMPDFADMFAHYDGVMLDERQGAMRGSDIARQIHETSETGWQFPILIMTLFPELIPYDVLDYVDVVVGKNVNTGRVFSPVDPLRGTRAWIRWHARLRAARAAASKPQ